MAMTYRPGVYAVVNTKTGECYIGSSTNMGQRWSTHKGKLRRGISEHTKLQKAWNEHGGESFKFQVVELIADISKLLEREQYYLDTMKPEYNTRSSADNSVCVPMTADGKRRMIEKNTGRSFSEDHRNKIGAKLKGRVYSEETIEKMKAAHSNMSEETRDKMRKAKLGVAPTKATIVAAAKNRGKKRPQEVVDKIRATKLRQAEEKRKLAGV